MNITIEKLQNAKSLLSVRALARESDIDPNTLQSKITRGTALTDKEAGNIKRALSNHKLYFK